MSTALFAFIFSLLLIHEMDAIRTREWKMLILLKDMAEEKAYKVFIMLHLPLYFVALYISIYGGAKPNLVLQIIVDVFLTAHSFIHFYFRKHSDNRFTSLFSKAVIYVMAVLSVIHFRVIFRLRQRGYAWFQ